MNRYGEIARNHWAEWLPLRYSQIENPEAFFENLGWEAATEVSTLYQAATETVPTYLSEEQAEGWCAMARQNAESQVLSELVYLTPESSEEEAPADSSFPHVIETQTLQEIYDDESLNPFP